MPEVMDLKFTRLELEEGVGILILHRPPINAINGPVLSEVLSVLKDWESDENVRAVVLTGGIRNAFCTGGDLDQLFGEWMQQLGYEKKLELFWSFQQIYGRIETFAKPLVAAINGVAIGAGLELALVCDYRVASELSYFSLPEVPRGIIPSLGATQRLPSFIGMGRAKEMMLFGKRINAETAFKWGLVNRVTPHKQVVSTSVALAKELGKMPSSAVKALKACTQLFKNGDGLWLETELFTELLQEKLKGGGP